MLKDWIADGTFIRDNRECYYIYELTMDGRTQTGIAACASIDDYANQVIKNMRIPVRIRNRIVSVT